MAAAIRAYLPGAGSRVFVLYHLHLVTDNLWDAALSLPKLSSSQKTHTAEALICFQVQSQQTSDGFIAPQAQNSLGT